MINTFKRRLVLLLGCTLSTMYAFSQSANYTWWEPYKNSFPVIEGILGNRLGNETGTYLKFNTNATDITIRYVLKKDPSLRARQTSGLVTGIDLHAITHDGKWIAVPPTAVTVGDTIAYQYNKLEIDKAYKGKDVECRLFLPLSRPVTWIAIGVPDKSMFTPQPLQRERPVVVIDNKQASGAWAVQMERRLDRPFIHLKYAANITQQKAQKNETLIKYVDPMVGTSASTTFSALKHGEGGEQRANTLPVVGVPFGMTQWTPQTRATEEKCVPPYMYKDNLLNGFRGTHWLSGSCVPDYGSFTIMPITGKLRTLTKQTATPFSHQGEVSRPDYYSVTLPDYHLKTEITATARCAMMQFTASKDDSLYLLITPNSDKGRGCIRIDRKANEVEGYNPAFRTYQGAGKPAGFSGHFVVQVQKRMGLGGTFCGANIYMADSIRERKDIGAYMGFKLKKGETLLVRIGTSFTSAAGARKNLQAEIPGWDFNSIRQQAAQKWEQALAKIKVTDDNLKNKHIFYTAMYHAMQMPRLYNDADGTYPMFAHQYTMAKLPAGKKYYDDFSMWDIYRAELPLLELLQRKLVNDLAQSMVLKGTQGGWMPIFPCWNSYTNEMVGDHTSAFIASAYLKGIKDYNIDEAYRLLRQNAFDTAPPAEYVDGKGRRALTSYLKYGYVPLEDPVRDAFHQQEQVSRTLEYAYDDYALAMLAKSLGKTDDYYRLIKRSGNYKNVIDPSVGLARGRHADGSWVTPFFPDKKVYYITEGTPRQYSFYVPQDVPGLATLMGGKAKLEAALDSLFIKGEYWHGNEPGNQISFMYNFTNAPWKTQRAVSKILNEEYTDGPGGLSGNDDAGQMSAWYVFAAIGFYPLDPVANQYQLCVPLFKQAVINLAGGKKFMIRVQKTTAKAAYIQAIKLNGKSYHKTYITYADIAGGGIMEMTLANKPTSTLKN